MVKRLYLSLLYIADRFPLTLYLGDKLKRKIFLDCGGHDGCSVIKFLSLNPDFEAVTFEPNPDLHPYYRYLPTRLIKKAVSTYDGKINFTVDHIDGDGSSICSEKPVIYDSSVANEQCPTINIDCADLSGYIKDNITSDDYLSLKLDVEGAEYQILKKMIEDGSINKVNKLYCEFHWDRCGIDKKVHDALVAELKKHTVVHDWDAAEFAIHMKGSSKAYDRALLLAKLWPRHLLHRFKDRIIKS